MRECEVLSDEDLAKDNKMVKINIEIPEKTYAIIMSYIYEDKKTGLILSNKSIETKELKEMIEDE